MICSSIRRLRKTGQNIQLITLSFGYLFASFFKTLSGRRFDFFGRYVGARILLRKGKFDNLLINPVSSVRCFEFDFVDRHIPKNHDLRLLDVSSPYLIGLYLVENYDVNYLYINPDANEFKRIEYLAQFMKQDGKYNTAIEDATNLPYEKERFDCVISISVIEHISGKGDSKAISEMWRTLKPGGRLILTFPVMRSYEEEYRNNNIYSLPDVEQKDDLYFFQRFYDETAVAKRLLDHLPGYKIETTELFGEIEKGFFKDYEKRWISDGLKETVKDPWLMATKMGRYVHLNELAGLGVMGLLLQKTV